MRDPEKILKSAALKAPSGRLDARIEGLRRQAEASRSQTSGGGVPWD